MVGNAKKPRFATRIEELSKQAGITAVGAESDTSAAYGAAIFWLVNIGLLFWRILCWWLGAEREGPGIWLAYPFQTAISRFLNIPL